MTFSNCRIATLTFIPKIRNHEKVRKLTGKVFYFLGVIVNDELTWKDHTIAVNGKMSRYRGILFKLKNNYP